ncbi:MAG: hypothetical protein M1820_008032 [Bogoriella megaspora]|nr:MAG: hypothetical protein M1820_008032 [Bogoriella megaspora]
MGSETSTSPDAKFRRSVIASILKLAALLGSFGTDISIDEDLLITEFLWWCMLEAGLALIACCLPTLQFLFKGLSAEAIIRSVRSVISLHSLRSQRSSRERIPDEECSNHAEAQKSSENEPREDFAFDPSMHSHSALTNKFELRNLSGPQTSDRFMVEERVDADLS